MSTLLAFFEVTIRNRIHLQMSRYTSHGTSQSSHWYDHLARQLKPTTVRKIVDVRTKMTPRVPSPDEIVSRVTFGFWSAILGQVPQNRGIFEQIFPHHPLSQPGTARGWSDRTARSHALSFMFELNDFRNRVAHHEPLWKFPPVQATNTPALPGSISEADSLYRLNRILNLIDSTVHAIEPQLQADMAAASWRRKLNFLLSPRGIQRYKNMKHAPKPNSATPAEFRRSFSLYVKSNQPVFVKRSRVSGIFIPD